MLNLNSSLDLCVYKYIHNTEKDTQKRLEGKKNVELYCFTFTATSMIDQLKGQVNKEKHLGM